MESHLGKRERLEGNNGSGGLCEEVEASPTKRLCKDSNVDFLCEVINKMDNEELGLNVEEIEEKMVWDMMRILEEEISSSPSCSDSNGSNELESIGNTDCIAVSDDEVGIHCSPSVNDYEYDSCGFFECNEIEEAEQKLLLHFWMGSGESVEQDGIDLSSIHDLHMVSNQIKSGFCKG